jgi:hypothetical protein
MKDEKLPKRATVAELSRIMERTQKQVRECIHARDLKRGKDMKYLVAPVLEEHLERQKRNTRARSNDAAESGELLPPATWADKLKAKQVEKLQVQLDEMRGLYMLTEEVKSLCSELTAAFKAGLSNLKQLAAAERRDPELSKWIDNAEIKTLRTIQESVESCVKR